MNRLQAREQSAQTARALLRNAGFYVESVAWIREHNDGEFAALLKWGHEDKIEEFLTDPRNTTVEYSRETKSRIFVKFTDAVMANWPK